MIAKAVNESAITVTREHLKIRGGIDYYDVEIEGSGIYRDKKVPKDDTFAVFSNLEPYKHIIVKIRFSEGFTT